MKNNILYIYILFIFIIVFFSFVGAIFLHLLNCRRQVGNKVVFVFFPVLFFLYNSDTHTHNEPNIYGVRGGGSIYLLFIFGLLD